MADIRKILNTRSTMLRNDLGETISDHVHLDLVSYDEEKGVYLMRTTLKKWMCNPMGRIHGGMITTLMDQAMGCVSFSVMPGDGIAPTVEMNVSFFRPLFADTDVFLEVKLKSITKQLIHLTCDVSSVDAPNKVCASSTAVFFYKPASEMR